MSSFSLVLADWFFLIFHTLFSLFNITGWIFRKTRKIHLMTISFTIFSWFFLGIWYGLGYCFCTEWHWQIRQMMGRPIQSHSYIHFLIQEITGANLNPALVDRLVMSLFIFTVICTVIINVNAYLNSNKK